MLYDEWFSPGGEMGIPLRGRPCQINLIRCVFWENLSLLSSQNAQKDVWQQDERASICNFSIKSQLQV